MSLPASALLRIVIKLPKSNIIKMRKKLKVFYQTYLDNQVKNVADTSNTCMDSAGRAGVKIFQSGKHRVIVRSIVACLAKDLVGDKY